MKIDKLNNELAFNEEAHKYWNIKYPNRQYTSVTTLIGKYHDKFDEDFWSSYKALQKLIGEDEFDGPNVNPKTGKRSPASATKKILLEKKKFSMDFVELYDIDPEDFDFVKKEILASYAKANADACERGNVHHNFKENRFYEKKVHNIDEYNFNLPITGMFPCEKNNFDLNREVAILPEYLIYFSTKDEILNLAGQVDLLIKQGNDLYILDYKTNAKGMETNSYFDTRLKRHQMMHYPINKTQDCMLAHYQLQLSIYAWMLQQINPEFNIKLLRLLHIDGNDVETNYDVEYVKDDVERLLKHYKKSIKIDYYRETGKML